MKLYQVDAFTEFPFKGNPAAVCFPDKKMEKGWMQAFSAEMNLSETAFLQLIGKNKFQLRWFTPAVEVDLCGHATLASAHILFTEGYLPGFEEVLFETRSGILTVRRAQSGLEMNFPLVPAINFTPKAELSSCFQSHVHEWHLCGENVMLVLNSEQDVLQEQPDFSTLKRMPHFGYIITAPSELNDFDFVSRYFAPAQGVDEDPVTGSAHCALAPYWARRLGKSILHAKQISARGGVLEVELAGQRVLIRGQAVTIFRGDVAID